MYDIAGTQEKTTTMSLLFINKRQWGLPKNHKEAPVFWVTCEHFGTYVRQSPYIRFFLISGCYIVVKRLLVWQFIILLHFNLQSSNRENRLECHLLVLGRDIFADVLESIVHWPHIRQCTFQVWSMFIEPQITRKYPRVQTLINLGL